MATSTSNTAASPADHQDSERNVTPVPRDSPSPLSDGDGSNSSETAVKPDDNKPSESALLPTDEAPPLPDEAPPPQVQDDGWDPVWDENAQAFYFYNRFTQTSQWENPRVVASVEPAPPGVGNYDRIETTSAADPPPAPISKMAGGYDPSIHGDYDPDADYAKLYQNDLSNGDHAALNAAAGAAGNGIDPYAATGTFNRFTGRWQVETLNPENFNDENKSRRQMNAYFDVDAAANSHDGKSLKAERSGKKLSKKELKGFKEKRRERKEEKRRAWLRD